MAPFYFIAMAALGVLCFLGGIGAIVFTILYATKRKSPPPDDDEPSP